MKFPTFTFLWTPNVISLSLSLSLSLTHIRNFAMGDDEALLCDNFGGEFKVTRYWNINDEDDKTSLPVGVQ